MRRLLTRKLLRLSRKSGQASGVLPGWEKCRCSPDCSTVQTADVSCPSTAGQMTRRKNTIISARIIVATLPNALSAILAGYTRESYSYDEQCADIRENLERRYHNVTVQGVTFDYSEAQAAQNDVVDAFYDVMKSGGYTRYGTWNLAKWFYYTNPVEYFTGYYWNKVLPLVF